MRRLASCAIVVMGLACSGGSSSPGGSGGGFAGSGGTGDASSGSGGASGTGGSGGSGGTACAVKGAACEDCVHQGCQMGDLLAECFQGEPDHCPQAWTDFKDCACAAHNVAAWEACLQSWQSAAGIEGVILGACLGDECKADCFGH